MVEQIIRPTGLVDPEVEVRPVKGQVDDLLAESGPRMLEIRSDRAHNMRRREEVAEAVREAVVARL